MIYHVFDFFFLFKLEYFTRKVKRLHERLWLVEMKHRNEIENLQSKLEGSSEVFFDGRCWVYTCE